VSPLGAVTVLEPLDRVGLALLLWHVILFDLSRYALSLSVVAVVIAALLPERRDRPAYRGAVSVLLVGRDEARGLEPSIRSLVAISPRRSSRSRAWAT
jgi:hypothetical protein